MNNPKDNGGPAFPKPHTIADANDPSFKLGSSGMSLRDYFAAKALPALVKSALDCNHESWDATAGHAYLIADAMLKERTK